MFTTTDFHRLLPTFLAAADCQNFSAAARQLGITPAAVSKNVRRLEQRLNMVLFRRNTHYVVLTEEGMRLRDQIAPLWRALEQTLDNPHDTVPTGVVRVSVIPGFARYRLLPLLNEFQRRWPLVRLDLSLEPRPVNLPGDRIDVAIGMQTSSGNRIVMREIQSTRMLIAASPAYLAQYGAPQTPADLAKHRCLRFRNADTGRLQPWLSRETEDELPEPWLISNHPDALLDAALNGMGIVCLSDWYLESLFRQEAMTPVLQNYWAAPRTMWVKYAGHKLAPRTRVFVDFLLENFKK